MVTLPEQALDALSRGACADQAIADMLDQLPLLADDVLRRIPRLDGVREIVREQQSVNGPFGSRPQQSLPGQILQAVREYDTALARGLARPEALELLGQRPHHDMCILDALHAIASVPEETSTCEVDVASLYVGAVMAADLRSSHGLLLATRGEPLSEQMLVRVRNYAALSGLAEPPVIFASPNPAV